MSLFLLLGLVCAGILFVNTGCKPTKEELPPSTNQIDSASVASTNILLRNESGGNNTVEAKYSISQLMHPEPVALVGSEANSTQIYAALRQAGVPSSAVILLGDDKYHLPSNSWVVNELWNGAREFMFQNGTLRYTKYVNDCDDQARQIVTYAQMYNTRNNIGAGKPLAIGEFWFVREKPAGAHAVVVVLVSEKGQAALRFVEITGTVIQLTEKEIGSCIHVRI